MFDQSQEISPGPVRVLPKVVKKVLPRDLRPGDLTDRRYGPGQIKTALVRITSVDKRRDEARGTHYLIRHEVPEGIHPNEMSNRYIAHPRSRQRVYNGEKEPTCP